MALPVIDSPIASETINCQISDISSATATTSSAYIRIPFRSRLVQCDITIFGAITTANATITVSQNGTSLGTVVITQAGSAAGNTFAFNPTALVHLNYGDYISFVSDHGSSTACPANCDVILTAE